MRPSGSLALPLAFLCILGCQKGPTLVTVSGRITMDNRPVGNAHVIFQSVEAGGKPDPNKEASAQTDDEGRYSLKMPSIKGDGAMPGTYRVEIHLIDRSGRGKSGIKDLIPHQYNRDSKLKFTVPPEGTKEANFDLKSK